ncbi:UvrD-helicase domain-containing protein [Duganella sp. FT135W]|uniref:DNA 3'-5' helicase n=1 Tax=Duganella flavida TaxID=2692175 RepID=A0A6L8KFM0_9BURK|nr:ATP-dependent helicase [Duganella flavida]MYM23261.1 UvrD-helicase domain-containing protein [Duganella flavida]
MNFAWDDDELNPEQSAAVIQNGNVFLIACPGSGKTRTLTYKIAYELSKITTHRDFVLAITYTNRAADEIRERVEDMGVDASQLWIGTIHSFCLEWIIKPYYIYEPDLAQGYSLIDLYDREKLLEELCLPYKLLKVTFHDCDFYFTPDGLHLACKNGSKVNAVKVVLTEYFKYLKKHRLIDFELILWYAFDILKNNQIAAKNLAGIFRNILVDEYQDTKELQYEIVSYILRKSSATNFFIVGDPNQAIYDSLGGYPIGLDDLKIKTGLDFHQMELSKNYRSSERVVSYFGNFNLYKTNIEACGKDKGYQSIVSYDREVSKDKLVLEIARIVKHNIVELAIVPRQICIIAPWWVHLASMCRKLSAELPEYTFDGPGMVPFARDVENIWYKISRIALTEPSPGMYIRRMRWAKEILVDFENLGMHLDNFNNKDFLRTCNSIKLDEHDGISYLRDFFAALIAEMSIDLECYPTLMQHHQTFFESSEKRVAQLAKEGIAEASDIKYFRKLFENRTGITVSTIHGVKGAEFDAVIAYGLLEGMVPHFSDANGQESAQKMLYVVASRARKNLFLISEVGRKRYGNEFYGPTRKLIDCNFRYDNF